jgi:hypothetical protein
LPRSAPPTTCILLWLDKLGLFYIHPSLFFSFLFFPGAFFNPLHSQLSALLWCFPFPFLVEKRWEEE